MQPPRGHAKPARARQFLEDAHLRRAVKGRLQRQQEEGAKRQSNAERAGLGLEAGAGQQQDQRLCHEHRKNHRALRVAIGKIAGQRRKQNERQQDDGPQPDPDVLAEQPRRRLRRQADQHHLEQVVVEGVEQGDRQHQRQRGQGASRQPRQAVKMFRVGGGSGHEGCKRAETGACFASAVPGAASLAHSLPLASIPAGQEKNS